MSLPRDLEDLSIDVLATELMRRVAARAKNICDYCGRFATTVACKFPERHASTVPLKAVMITAARVTYDHDGAHRVLINENPPVGREMCTNLSGCREQNAGKRTAPCAYTCERER